MGKIFRSILAILAGIIVTGVVIMAGELVLALFQPPPANPNDKEAMRQYIASLPPGAFAGVLAGWAIGTFAGAWVAGRLAGRAPMAHAMVIGVLFLLAGIANLLAFPHPAWFWALTIPLFPVAAWLAGKLAKRKISPAPIIAT